MFAVSSMVGGPFTADDNVFDRPEAIQELREEQTQLRETLDDLRSERETLAAAKGPTETVDGRIEESERELRSEEHTSELQSLMRISYAVFCLKKKQNRKQST